MPTADGWIVNNSVRRRVHREHLKQEHRKAIGFNPMQVWMRRTGLPKMNRWGHGHRWWR